MGFLFFLAICLAGYLIHCYNTLRKLAEYIKEAWSNIGVAGRKQVSLINQLIDVVKGYQESEKLVMLKVSDDMSSTNSVSQMQQQSGMVLSTVSSVARQFPELKSNDQYKRLIDSIQKCEDQMETARKTYNEHVRNYNLTRTSVPTVLFARQLGFITASFLEFDGGGEAGEKGAMKQFTTDDDGERLNALLGQAGNKLLGMSSKAIEAGKDATEKAIESGKAFAKKAQDKIHESNVDPH